MHRKRRSPSSHTVSRNFRSASTTYVRADGVPGLPGETAESQQLGMPGAADHRPYGMPGAADHRPYGLPSAADHRPYGMPGAADHRPYGMPGGLPEGWDVKTDEDGYLGYGIGATYYVHEDGRVRCTRPSTGLTPPIIPPVPGLPESPPLATIPSSSSPTRPEQTPLREGQAVLIRGLESRRLRVGVAHMHVI